MLGRTPTEAYHNFIEPNQLALHTIAVGRLLLARKHGSISVETPLAVALNGGVRVPVKWFGSGQIFIEVGMLVRISALTFGQNQFECAQIGYWHRFSDRNDHEFIAYHWTPNVRGNERSYPHLHVGSAVSQGPAKFRGDFHKLHVPTGIVSVSHLVRFAIQEMGVMVRPGLDRASVLSRLDHTIGDT